MKETGISKYETNWTQIIAERRSVLESVQSALVELESDLADQLAAINAFEYELRARVRPLISRVEELESEINGYRDQLRQERVDEADGDWSDWSVEGEGAASSGDYRYWGKSAPPPSPRTAKVDALQLKRLFRQLARRFHPDMARDEADRAYRTGIMMAINVAYANGDLDRLQELALEPDASQRVSNAQTDEQLADALLREIEQCHRRIDEIRIELNAADEHASARLMRRVNEAAAKGVDLLADMIRQLREEISQKMVERDVLKAELASTSEPDMELSGEALAYVVWDSTVDDAYDEMPETRFTDQLRRRKGFHLEDDILDDVE